MATKRKKQRCCPKCEAPMNEEDLAYSTCPFCFAELPLPWTDALERRTVSLAKGGEIRKLKEGEVEDSAPRRIIPLPGLPEQARAQEDLHDYHFLVERRRAERFVISLYEKPGQDPRRPARAELWQRTPPVEPDPRGAGGVWRLVRTVPPDRVEDLEAEAQRLNKGRALDRWEITRIKERVETRGRPGKHLPEWERDRRAAFAGKVTREYIREKYSKGRRCPQCGTFIPDSWPRKECSPRCTQQAFLARKKKRG